MRESKSLLAEIIDCILLVTVLTAGLFIVLRTRLNALDALFAALTSVASVLSFIRARDLKTKAKEKRTKNCERCLKSLTFAGEKQRLEYFAKAFGRFDEFTAVNGYLIGKSGKKRVYPLFVPSPAIPGKLSRIHDECADADCKAVVVMPSAPDPAVLSFIADSGRIKALYGEKLYDLIDDCSIELPDTKKSRKGKFKTLMKTALKRELFRRYLFSGALLIGTSYILPTSPLYIAMGALCIALAIATLIPIGKKKQRKTQN